MKLLVNNTEFTVTNSEFWPFPVCHIKMVTHNHCYYCRLGWALYKLLYVCTFSIICSLALCIKSYNTLIGAAILFGPSYDMGYNCSLVNTDECQFLIFSKTAAHAWFQNWELYMQIMHTLHMTYQEHFMHLWWYLNYKHAHLDNHPVVVYIGWYLASQQPLETFLEGENCEQQWQANQALTRLAIYSQMHVLHMHA